MSKKTYTLPQNLSSDLGSTMEIVKNNIGTLNYRIVPLTAIEIDPNNPRELSITLVDIHKGIDGDDKFFSKKSKELDSLNQMAESIKKYGVRNAVEIYEFESGYRLIHGERRYLSSILAGKKDIPAKVLDNKPNNYDLRLLQFIENAQREDLSLYETLNNIQMIIDEYRSHIDSNLKVDAAFLESLINKSRSHCFNLLSVLNATDDLREAIKNGKVKAIEKASLIANATNKTNQEALLDACISGATIKEMKLKAKSLKQISKISIPQKSKYSKKPGQAPIFVKMGKTKNKKIIEKLINLVSLDNGYKNHLQSLKGLSLDTHSDCTKAFEYLIKLMEKIEIS
jgi:ParB family chromosome partitioning protein